MSSYYEEKIMLWIKLHKLHFIPINKNKCKKLIFKLLYYDQIDYEYKNSVYFLYLGFYHYTKLDFELMEKNYKLSKNRYAMTKLGSFYIHKNNDLQAEAYLISAVNKGCVIAMNHLAYFYKTKKNLKK